MRFILIPGFGEDSVMFNKISSHLQGEKIFLDHWSLLEEIQEKNLTVEVYAQYLVERFKITDDDIIIGHSLGGWIALYIKEIVGCSIVQVASWTDTKKVIRPPVSRKIIYHFARKNLIYSDWIKNILVTLSYRNKPSEEIFRYVFDQLKTGDKKIVVKQLMVIFTPVKKISVIPDIRIHAKGDKIVRYPDEEFIKVPGDHFTLYTHPEEVYHPINEYIKKIKSR